MAAYRTTRPKRITKVFNERMAERGRSEARRRWCSSSSRGRTSAPTPRAQRAQSLQRRTWRAKTAENIFGQKYQERVEFDRRKARDEAQQEAWPRL